MTEKALSHIRVLELGRILAGPWAGQLLADLGAQVIKVERPGKGDDTRQWGPPYLQNEQGEPTNESAYYLAANRGKQSVTIDITRPQGQQAIRDLVAQCDVLIENFKVDGLKKYGLDYDSLRAVNPRLVYCSVTGFGQTGPYRHRPGYDIMIQAMGGLMSVTGERDELPGGGPQKVGIAVVDLFTGLYAAVAIQAALAEREKSGLGQHIDLALLDVQVASLSYLAMNYIVGGQIPQRMGNTHPSIVPYQSFPTADGHIVLAVGNDGQFAAFCEVAGCPDLAKDPAYATNPQRVKNRDKLCEILTQALSAHDTAYWLNALEQRGVPCGPINRIDQVFADEQVIHRQMQQTLEHPLSKTVAQVGNPIKLSRTPIELEQPAPTLGQHNHEIFADLLGYDEQTIQNLVES